MFSRLLMLAIISLIALAQPQFGLETADRAVACNPGRTVTNGTWFDGWIRNAGAGTVGGVYSQILNLNTYVVPGNQGTAAWVMVNRAGQQQWAQIGWVKLGGTQQRHTLIQVKNSSTDITTRYDWPFPVDAYETYTVLYNNTPGKFTFFVNNSQWPDSNYSVNAGFVPNEAQVFGETKNFNNQMPGAANQWEAFFGTNVYINSWQVFNGTLFKTNGTEHLSDGPYFQHTLYIRDADCQANG